MRNYIKVTELIEWLKAIPGFSDCYMVTYGKGRLPYLYVEDEDGHIIATMKLFQNEIQPVEDRSNIISMYKTK